MSLIYIRDKDGILIPVETIRGPQGNQGPIGKSAYEHAKDAGYTGTEEEFAAKLEAWATNDIPIVQLITWEEDD